MAKKNIITKIMAFLALFGIIIGVLGTGILILFNSGNSTTQQEILSPEEMLELQNMIESQSEKIINNGTGANSLTGEIN